MLKNIDVGKVFRVAQSRGYIDCEIYAESVLHTQISFRGKIQDVRLFQTGGVSLRCHDGDKVRHVSSHNPTTESLLALLGHEEPGGPGSQSFERAESAIHPQKFDTVLALARALGCESNVAHLPSLTYADQFKTFAVADSAGIRAGGDEESASLHCEWFGQREGREIPFREERHRSRILRLLEEIANPTDFKERIERTLNPPPPWPSPRGEIPVLWSARAFSKLCLQFLRAFEGDLFLRSASFLTDLPTPLPLHFRVEDVPDTTYLPVDHEGSPRRTITLFHEGRPKGLACDREIARQLSVPSTGHCRRQSYQTPPTVGFWNPTIRGHRRTENLMKNMEWGLFVDDIHVIKFCPLSTELTFQLRGSRLVHHGEKGEAIEPITLTFPLLDLLQRARLFSEQGQTFGFPIYKHGQSFLTEIVSPEALSDPLAIPGQVPPSNYW